MYLAYVLDNARGVVVGIVLDVAAIDAAGALANGSRKSLPVEEEALGRVTLGVFLQQPLGKGFARVRGPLLGFLPIDTSRQRRSTSFLW